MLFQILSFCPSLPFAFVPLQFSFDLWGEKGGLPGLIIAALLFMMQYQNNRVFTTLQTTLHDLSSTLSEMSKNFVAIGVRIKTMEKDIDDIKSEVTEIKSEIKK